MTLSKLHVLVVEDDPSTRSGYTELLSRYGFATRAAQNGIAALREIRSRKPDILLSDLEMPEMNGYELLSIVRRAYPEVRTVAMSGAYGGDDIPPGVAADAFYAKGGFQISRLLAILNEVAAPTFSAARHLPPDIAVSSV
jgi:CheY-like chemotaxis protein